MSRDSIVFMISGTEFRAALLKRIAELEPIAKYVNTLNREIQDNYEAHYRKICDEAGRADKAEQTAWQQLPWWKRKLMDRTTFSANRSALGARGLDFYRPEWRYGWIPNRFEELKGTLAAVDDSRQYQVPMDLFARYPEEDALMEEVRPK